MRRSFGVLSVGLAVLACALPFSIQRSDNLSPTSSAATAAPSAVPATSSSDEKPDPTAPASLEPQLPSSVSALPDPASASWQPVVTGLSRPLDLTHAGDERLFIVEQAGLIGIYDQGQLIAEPFLDIRDRIVVDGFEQGLLGLAFHPNFANNGYFYVNYTGQGGDTRISRFSLSNNPQIADPDSELVILTYQQPYKNHNGGGITFGPDGYLYIAAGDGGSANDPQDNAQNLNTLLGKLLRIDVNTADGYGIPTDNPFIGQENARDEIWDYGLRNPWRFSFDSLTGDLYIADVGQNQWEEINVEPADSQGGINYGWDLWEGKHVFEGGGEGTVMPIVEYSHEFGCSVTGGVVVRSPSLPDWNGVYLYGDFCSGNLWTLVRGTDGSWLNELAYRTDFSPSAFGTDFAGEVYLVDHDGGLYQLSPAD